MEEIYEQIKIIYEDKNYLIVYKPYNLTVHKPNIKYPFPTLADFLIQKYPELKNVGDDPILRPGIVHRLDKETSGIMLIPRNQDAYNYYKKLFKNGKIVKKYYVLVHGNVYNDFEVDKPTMRSKTDGAKFCTPALNTPYYNQAKNALTKFEVIKNYKGFCLLRAIPKTGRTHQIRVHLQSVSRIAAGDKLYKPKKFQTPRKLNRLFLHAYYLGFKDQNGNKVEYKIGLPKDLSDFLKTLQDK
ncbi:MAG TPA: RluA family pseudouridine synthase [bacterium]|nr:RluA family pseudouridine synthase [bacterium]